MHTTRLVLTLLGCAAALSAQSATFTTYGQGCSAPATTPCVAANWGQPFAGNTGAAANFAILGNSGSTTLVVCGVELFCKTSAGSPKTMTVSLNARDLTSANGQPGAAFGTSSMLVGGTAAAYRATFSPPIILNANTDFFVVFDNRVGLNLPIMSSGTLNTHFYNGPPTWNGPYVSQRWNYQLLCCGGTPAIPALSNTGTPQIGGSFTIDLANAPANVASLLALGITKTAIDLAIAGAPGCTLYTDIVFLLGVQTSAAGAAAFKIGVPNDVQVLGFKFYAQYAAPDAPANALGLVFSNGGEGTGGR